MPYSFTERTPLEAGFEAVFHERIVPVLERREAERGTLRDRAVSAMGLTGALGAGGLGSGLALDYEAVGVAAGVFGGMGAIASRSHYESRWQSGLGEKIVPVLCDFLGDMRHGRQEIDLAPFESLGVIPAHDRATLEDPVSGWHHEARWAMTEATLVRRVRRRRRRRSRTVFRGLLFRIRTLNPAPRIYFARDRGGLVNWVSESLSPTRAGMQKIHVPEEEFERIYEIYTDDVPAALDYIGPEVVSGLKAIAAEEGRAGSYIGCAFEGDWFYLALPRRADFLSLGSLFRPAHDIEDDLHRALSDLDLPRRMIDRMSGL
jgi:hypothetical protein